MYVHFQFILVSYIFEFLKRFLGYDFRDRLRDTDILREKFQGSFLKSLLFK